MMDDPASDFPDFDFHVLMRRSHFLLQEVEIYIKSVYDAVYCQKKISSWKDVPVSRRLASLACVPANTTSGRRRARSRT